MIVSMNIGKNKAKYLWANLNIKCLQDNIEQLFFTYKLLMMSALQIYKRFFPKKTG
jgi:hypothetical protein